MSSGDAWLALAIETARRMAASFVPTRAGAGVTSVHAQRRDSRDLSCRYAHKPPGGASAYAQRQWTPGAEGDERIGFGLRPRGQLEGHVPHEAGEKQLELHRREVIADAHTRT